MVNDVTDSDHNVLTYKIGLASAVQTICTKRRYNIRKANWDVFILNLTQNKNTINNSSIEDHAKSIMKVIETATDKSMPKVRTVNIKVKQPWWNQVLSQLKKVLDRTRRLGLHRTDRPTYIRARNLYLAEILQIHITTNKINCNVQNLVKILFNYFPDVKV